MDVKTLIENQFHHFNSGELKRAAQGYKNFIEKENGKMMLTMAGAMSTARLGISVAEMIRSGKIHAICCTGANLEEDVYNLFSRKSYREVVDHRNIDIDTETKIAESDYSRITDVAVPESSMIAVDSVLVELWEKAVQDKIKLFPHQYMQKALAKLLHMISTDVDKSESWLLAAMENNVPVFVPGWEDSTEGNSFTAFCMERNVDPSTIMCSGIDYMMELANWYMGSNDKKGFFQIGGGIAGDFPICVVPMLQKDFEMVKNNPSTWGYFCQISDSTTSYGSYSGALPSEKITWGKITKDTPSFMIESDATIVWPLIAAYVLN